MKHCLAILAAIAMVGAFGTAAAAVDWNFYGNARMSTFWESVDLGDDFNEALEADDGDLTWELQSNSRFGAKVKHDNVNGRFEYGTGVNVRHLWGEWNFGSGKMLVGQTYTPISDASYSSQVFAEDLALNGFGTPYASRRGMLRISFWRQRIKIIDTGCPEPPAEFPPGVFCAIRLIDKPFLHPVFRRGGVYPLPQRWHETPYGKG